MKPSDRPRIIEALAIFAGREELYDVGQLTDKDITRLKWCVKRGIVQQEKRPWPGPLVGTCIKTCYVRLGGL